MKSIIAAMLLLMASTAGAGMHENIIDALQPETKSLLQSPVQPASKDVCEKLKADGASGEILAGRGCCSWHQGQCGCSMGRVICCDGSTSPSCGC